MRIAVTGTHGSGKTTLVDDFADAFRHFEPIPEPYWDLAEQGMLLPGEPTVDSFLTQLHHSLSVISASGAEAETDVIFDRCPLDFIAYLEVISEQNGTDWFPSGSLLTRIEAALAALDLIVFLPLSEPDQITADIEYQELRGQVDERLKSILREDELGLLENGPRIIELTGSPQVRIDALVKTVPALQKRQPI
ncbi:MAG: AAA family ATPase [Stappiaceae bacterium]